jgi:hypothetical protein
MVYTRKCGGETKIMLIHKDNFLCLISKQSDKSIDFQRIGGFTNTLSTKLSTPIWGN